MRSVFLAAALTAAVATSAVAQPKPKAAPAAPAAPGAPTAADWRTPDPNDVLVIDTNKGRIIVEMVPEIAPNHVQRLRELTREKLYDGLRFFRVVDGFMDQTGDPQNTGEGGSSKPDIAAEFLFRRGPDMPFGMAVDQTVAEIGFVKSVPVMTQSMMLAPMTRDQKVSGWALYCPGVAAMARADAPDSANSQFFLMRNAYPALEKRYTAWGRVISGQPAVLAIKVGEPVPDPQDRMERVRVLADIPEGERPKVRVIDTKGAWFKAEAARVRAAKGAAFTACDIDIPVEVK
ncbi:MAG: peptidylprolyl isomerase [Phenylobacterium sp.]